MLKSESIKELATALSKAQSKMKNPSFDAVNPHFKSKYATLAAVRDAVIPALSAEGLSVIQDVHFIDDMVICTNILMHNSGEWMETAGLQIPLDKRSAHGIGSATTYSRRFSLMALAGVVGDVDDDGNAAVETKGPVVIKHKPNDGAGDELSSDTKNLIADIAISIKDAIEIDEIDRAYTLYLEVSEHEEKLYLWSLLDSATRRKIKEHGKAAA